MHRCGKELVLAAADKELLDSTLKEGEIRLEVSCDFYKGQDASEEMLVNRLGICTVANLVGKETVEVAMKHGFVSVDCVMLIEGIPHAQMVKM